MGGLEGVRKITGRVQVSRAVAILRRTMVQSLARLYLSLCLVSRVLRLHIATGKLRHRGGAACRRCRPPPREKTVGEQRPLVP